MSKIHNSALESTFVCVYNLDSTTQISNYEEPPIDMDTIIDK